MKIACVGAGSIGRSWALLFALNERSVSLFDPSDRALGAALAVIRNALADMETAGTIDRADAVLSRIEVTNRLEQALSGATYVQESATEQLAVKKSVFASLDRIADKDAILASSTSEIAASLFTKELAGRRRCLVVHPMNPPHVIPLVELCPAPWTGDDVVAEARRLLCGVGLRPVHLRREISGFLVNRLQAAVMAEALHLVSEGCCHPEDVDAAIKYGLGRRWALRGLFEAGHLNSDGGFKEYLFKYEEMLRSIVEDLHLSTDWDHDSIQRIDQYCRSRMGNGDIATLQRKRDSDMAGLAEYLRGRE